MAALIIGIGNSLRGDDGIGPVVIDELASRNLPGRRLMAADLTGLDLIKYFRPDERIIIIDAAVMGEEPGTVRIFTVEDLGKAQFNSATSTHGMGLPATLKLAREIGYNNKIWIIGVQVQTYSYQTVLSEQVSRAISRVIEIIGELL